MPSVEANMDELFEDGVANAGAIYKRGNEVVRPLQPHSSSVHQLLKHLQQTGFSGAPAPIALDVTTERISFMPGEVPALSYPPWCLEDKTLYEIAGLQRRYHDAVKSFHPEENCQWNTSLADPTGLGIVCHNDLGPGNIVFNNGHPTGFIDWDFAAPGRALWDAARCARAWIPLDDPQNAATYGFGGLDPIKRLQVFCDGYGMSKQQKMEMLDLLNQCNKVSVDYVASQVKQGKPAFMNMWKDYKLDELYKVRTYWIESNHDTFVQALT
jgi:hypothetical protein